MKEFEALAVILWGLLSVVLLFLLAVHVGSFWGAIIATLTGGATYFFQAVQFEATEVSKKGRIVLSILQLFPVALFIIAMVLIATGV